MRTWRILFRFGLVTAAVVLGLPATAAAQKEALLARVPVPGSPFRLTADPLTDRVYVALYYEGRISVIDTHTNAVVQTFPVAARPSGIAINPVTQRLYVTHGLTGAPGQNSVEVIDPPTGAVLTSVVVGGGPEFVGVNTVTNKIYAAQTSGRGIAVIDGATNAVVKTISLSSDCRGLAIDEASNTIFAAVRYTGELVVIDGASDTVVRRLSIGGNPFAVAVDPVRGRVYVTKDGLFVPGDVVTILDENALTELSTIAVGARPLGVAVDPNGGKAYVSSLYGGTISVLDGATGVVERTMPSYGPYGVAVNPSSHRAYVADAFGSNVVVVGEDNDAPIWPANAALTVYARSLKSLALQWPAATDNSIEPIRYSIYKDGTLSYTFSAYGGSTVYAGVYNLTADTAYQLEVQACDAVDNCATTRLSIVARTQSVQSAVQALIDSVDGLATSGALTKGQATGLDAKLQEVVRQYQASHLSQAIHLLDAFLNEVYAMIQSEKLSWTAALPLLNQAYELRAYLNSV